MKKYLKKMAIVLSVLTFLSGCNKATDGFTTVTGQDITKEVQEIIWNAEYTSLHKEYQQIVVQGDSIYACYEDDGNIMVDYLSKTATIEQQVVVTGISSVLALDVDMEGNVYVTGANDKENKLFVIDKNSAVIELSNLVLTDTDKALFLSPKGVLKNNSGNYLVWYEMSIPVMEMIDGQEQEIWRYTDRVYVMDEQFNTLFYSQVDAVEGVRLQDVQVKPDGNPVLIIKDREGIFTREIDIQNQKILEDVRLSSIDNIANLMYFATTQDGFIYVQGNDLYEYSTAKQQCSKKVALYDYGIDASNILYLGKNGAEIEIVDNSGNSGNAEFIVLREGASDKLVLTLGTLYATEELKNAVAQFNRYSKTAQIKVVNYYNEYDVDADYRDGLEQLKLDIISSNAPDILDVSSIDTDLLASKGVFVDLYEYIDKDAECNREKMLTSVLQVYETDGHLYSVSPAFQLYSMWGSENVLGNQTGVNLQQLMQILSDKGKDLNAISGFSADEPVLRTLCTFAMDEFIDWEKGTCDFEGRYFQELLQFAGEYKGGFTGGSTALGVRQGSVLMSVGMIYNVADYQIQKEIYGDEISFIGYPVKEGTGTAVSFRGGQLAINAGNGHQDEAWEFVKYYLLNGYDGTGFPVMEEQFEEAMQQAMTPDMVKDENGTYEMPKGNYMTDDTSLSVFAASQEDVQRVRELIATAQHRFEYHTEIMEIIESEAELYFQGQKSLEQTAAIIQNRVSLYLEEQLQ